MNSFALGFKTPLRNKGSPKATEVSPSASEYQDERTLNQFRNQVRALRHSIDIINEEHLQEVDILRAEHIEKVKFATDEGEIEVQRLRRCLDEARADLERQTKARTESEKQFSVISGENCKLRGKITTLTEEINSIKSQTSSLETEKKNSVDTHRAKLENIEKEHSRTLKCMQEVIRIRESDLKDLESMLSSVRKDIDNERGESDKRIHKLKTEIQATNDSLDTVRSENQKLRASKDELEQEKRDLVTQTNKLTFEVSTTQQENKNLEGKIERLSKLIYGDIAQ